MAQNVNPPKVTFVVLVGIILVGVILAFVVLNDTDEITKDISKLPKGSEKISINPLDFTPKIDNPYFPLKPDSKWIYQETDASGQKSRVEVTVTNRIKKIVGVNTVVVHDRFSFKGQTVEDTYDWYAQDKNGNVWYFGEDTKEYENGKVKSTEGSWQAGVDGAQPGVIMPAQPKVGLGYRQEYFKGHAEDSAFILSTDERVDVPFGTYSSVILTKEFTPVEPSVREYKFYARDVGEVMSIDVAGGSDHSVLMDFQKQ